MSYLQLISIDSNWATLSSDLQANVFICTGNGPLKAQLYLFSITKVYLTLPGPSALLWQKRKTGHLWPLFTNLPLHSELMGEGGCQAGCRERAGEKDGLPPCLFWSFLMGSAGVLCNINPKGRANRNRFFFFSSPFLNGSFFNTFAWVLHLFFFPALDERGALQCHSGHAPVRRSNNACDKCQGTRCRSEPVWIYRSPTSFVSVWFTKAPTASLCPLPSHKYFL